MLCLSFLTYAQKTFHKSGDFLGTTYFIEKTKASSFVGLESYQFDFHVVDQLEIYLSKSGFQIKQLQWKKDYKDANDIDFEEEEKGQKLFQAHLTFEWLNTNTQVEIIKEQKSHHYFTQGAKEANAFGYKKIRYNNLYNNIDVIYELDDNGNLHYSLLLHPGADISDISFKYKDDARPTLNGKENKIIIHSPIDDLVEYGLHAFYSNNENVKIAYKEIKKNTYAFVTKDPLKINQTLIIDPWITALTTLAGQTTNQSQKAYDVDYDLMGNLYVFGGGGSNNTNGQLPKVAKYDTSGNLVWTFLGTVATVPWYSNVISNYVGNFIVDKYTNKIYIGQGYNTATGSRIVRLDSAGVYNNFISVPVANMQEVWDFTFNCNTGDLIAYGGSTSSNLNFAVVDTINGNMAFQSITNQPGSHQDVVCGTINSNGECIAIFNSLNATPVHQDIYKINSSYTASIWNVDCGYTALLYNQNKQIYSSSSSMGFNALAVNDSLVFYYDGLNIKAFSMFNGNVIGNSIVVPGHFSRTQGGIYANNCNDVFVGGKAGNILKYHFDGTNFSIMDTLLASNTTTSVWDIKYNSINNYLYVCGNGFVSVVDPLTSCNANNASINFNLSTFCPDTAIITISNPIPGASYSFIWEDSITNTILQSGLSPSGTFSDTLVGGYAPGQVVKVTVSHIQACQISSNFAYFSLVCNSDSIINRCVGDTVILMNNAIVTTSGTYHDTLQNMNNQDSIINYFITFHPSYNFSNTYNICPTDSVLLPNGNYISTAGIYYHNYTTAAGCDSNYTSTINLFPTYNVVHWDTICANQTFTLPSNLIVSSAGTYIDTFSSVLGCDSFHTSHLYVHSISIDTIVINICLGSTYQLPDSTFASNAGYYTSVLTNVNNCDSIIVTQLIVHNAVSNILNYAICQGDSVQLPSGMFVSLPGIYKDSFITVFGCDSLYTTVVSLNPTYSTIIFDTICDGQNYFLPSNTIVNSAGVYYDTLQTVLSCDSTFIINLASKASSRDTMDVGICYGKTFTLPNGDSVAIAGYYVSSFVNQNQCDSLIITHLYYLPNEAENLEFTICSNESFTLPSGRIVQLAGFYLDTVKAQLGCDSLYSIKLNVIDSLKVDFGLDLELCEGEQITLDAKNYGVVNYLWQDSSSKSTYKVNSPGTYFVTVSHPPCLPKSDTIKIDFVTCNCRLALPNAFTPNKDGRNDVFKPIFQCLVSPQNYEFVIYNRWGNRVFETNYIEKGWDGTYLQKDCELGTYFYHIRIKNEHSKANEIYQGDVQLIR